MAKPEASPDLKRLGYEWRDVDDAAVGELLRQMGVVVSFLDVYASNGELYRTASVELDQFTPAKDNDLNGLLLDDHDRRIYLGAARVRR